VGDDLMRYECDDLLPTYHLPLIFLVLLPFLFLLQLVSGTFTH
jgi:hypothetical protein